MEDWVRIAGAVLIGLVLVAMLYAIHVASRFTYTFEPEHLLIHLRLPGGLRFASRRIPYARIEAVRRFSWRLDACGFGETLGNLPSRKGCVLILRRSFFRRGLYRKLWITPDDLAAFAAELTRHGVGGAGDA